MHNDDPTGGGGEGAEEVGELGLKVDVSCVKGGLEMGREILLGG